MLRTYILIAATALLLAACQSALPVQPNAEEPTYTGTLRVGLHGERWARDPYPAGADGWANQTLQERSKMFMEQYPGVEIEFVNVAYDRNFEQILADPGLMPDILELTVFEARLVRDRIESLAQRIEAEAVRWQGDYMNVIELAKVDGDSILLPLTSDPLLVFYETNVLASNGVPLPEEGWTLVDFAAAGQQLTQAGHGVGHALTLNAMEPFINGLGGQFMSADGRITGVFDSEASVQAFVRYAELLQAASGDGQAPSGPVETVLRVERASSTSSTLGRYSAAPLPDAPDGKRYNNALMTGLAILKDSRQHELAWEYMRYVLGESSDEALDNVVLYTLEKFGRTLNFRNGQEAPQVFEDTKRWMRHEITFAPPAAFDLVWYDGNREGLAPQRPLQQLYGYTNAEAAKSDLALWAQELQAHAEALSAP
ncbi:MAG: hypothetical protein C6W55_16100 [Thermobacillus sp.]|jgi:multiple sugar transport system substrate-binding protein|uniref:ABC transporter substrate-binding protein n=1 Tax=Thermobacillus sp. TaxID=2108467 RepID=UPI000E3B3D4B|nr:extracellular solute-binding protein [Thermobacillus sp.]REK52503.1 MAG: hypothetical protein C6W55_16100 [Thermobacillus sp.]